MLKMEDILQHLGAFAKFQRWHGKIFVAQDESQGWHSRVESWEAHDIPVREFLFIEGEPSAYFLLTHWYCFVLWLHDWRKIHNNM